MSRAVDGSERCACGGAISYAGVSGRVDRTCAWWVRGLCDDRTHPWSGTRASCDECGDEVTEWVCGCEACREDDVVEADAAKRDAALAARAPCVVAAAHTARARWHPVWGRLVA